MTDFTNAKDALLTFVENARKARAELVSEREKRHADELVEPSARVERAKAELDAATTALTALQATHQTELDTTAPTLAAEDQSYADFIAAVTALPASLAA
jgi:hypothetical protein